MTFSAHHSGDLEILKGSVRVCVCVGGGLRGRSFLSLSSVALIRVGLTGYTHRNPEMCLPISLFKNGITKEWEPRTSLLFRKKYICNDFVICNYSYSKFNLSKVRFLFFKSSYAHQGCIYLIENTVKPVIFCYIKMYNVSYFNILFNTLMQFTPVRVKLIFMHLLIQSSVSHDSSEIINMLIWCSINISY